MKNYAEFGLKEMIKKYGEWTAYDIQLADNVYTYQQRYPFFQLSDTVQMIRDFSKRNFSDLRIVDLACLEGQYAIEFGIQGATVIGIEGREANIQKAIFAKEVLGVNNTTFIQDDVRNLSVEKYGLFDVVFCSGILYHLDVPDVFNFLDSIAQVCNGFAIIDTHISINPTVSFVHNNYTYNGEYYIEHTQNSSKEERLNLKWASLDNEKAFWLTKASLYNYLKRSGFSYILEKPRTDGGHTNAGERITILAFKSDSATLFTSPITNHSKNLDFPEL